MSIVDSMREKPLQGVGMALAVGIGASFLVPAMRRSSSLRALPTALGAVLGPFATKLAHEGAERIFAFAVEQLQRHDDGKAARSARS